MKNKFTKKQIILFIVKLLISAIILYVSFMVGAISSLVFAFGDIPLFFGIFIGLIPVGLIPLLFMWKKKKIIIIIWLVYSIIVCGILGTIYGIQLYEKSLVIDTSPNINNYEYLPFEKDSKIVKLDDANMKLEGDLPIIDGAAAVFPVYSAFVHAVYPENTEYVGYSEDGIFKYNNTVDGYQQLAEKKTDIFFGAKPSAGQVEYAESQGTEFEYIPIGYEGFVFFTHKDNPVDNLTTQQIKDIYSGKITNWKEVGGKDEKIIAYQRNEGSGSQSMLQRFMDGTPIMKAPTEQVNDLMSGIIDVVADYKSESNSIGFSFRYYVEGIIKNSNIKLLAIDGVKPTVETIRDKSYPIVANLFAVTYKNNDNENVQKLLDWILSDEGQYIIEKTGYVSLE